MDLPINSQPLLIREILSIIFQYLTIEELKIARQVCSYWRPIGWSMLTKRVLICFRTSSAVESYTDFFLNPSNSLTPFMSYKFKIKTDSIIVSEFLSSFGSRISRLDMEECNVFLSDELQRLLPLLQRLCINTCKIDTVACKKLRFLKFLELYCETPNCVSEINDILCLQNYLKSLKVTLEDKDNRVDKTKLIQTIAKSTSLQYSHFQELNLNFLIDSSELYNLTKLGLRFKKLQIILDTENNAASLTEVLFEFLQSQSDCIFYFKCRFSRWWKPEAGVENILYLNNLQEISLEYIFGDLQFLREYKRLRKLTVLYWRPDLRPFLFNPESISIMPFIESAVISLSGFPSVFAVLDYLTTIFPSLKLFKFNANVTGDTGIYSDLIRERLPNLREMCVEREELLF